MLVKLDSQMLRKEQQFLWNEKKTLRYRVTFLIKSEEEKRENSGIATTLFNIESYLEKNKPENLHRMIN